MSTSHAKFALRGIAGRSLLVASLSLASSVVRAQTPKPFQVNCGLSAAPSVVGQWSGPYDLTQITSEHATPTKPLAEITHAAVLPNGGGVLMWCRMTTLDPNAHGGNFGPTHTWLWNPASPTNVTKLDVPNPFDGSKDIWCGGHNWRDDGKLVAFGGSDLRFPPSPGVPWTGTFGAFAFDPASPGWTALPDLTKPRWYPTGFPCPDSVFRVFGTYGLPAEFPPGSGEAPADYADRFLTAGTWEKKLNMLSDPNCVELSPISFDPVTTLNYPACFLLAKGKKIFFMATSLGSPVVQVPEEQTNHFLDLLVCPSSATKDRWQSNSSLNPHGHEEGSPAHFVTFDAQNQIQDTIYVLGGTDSVGGVDAVVNAVDKITNPVPGAIFDTSPLDLHTAREHLNSVIGADGALFVIGGEDDANAYGCVERYDPPEVFGTSAGTSWFLQAGQQHARVYHSVAGLLDDGRIFSAGGVDNPHSIEVYSPRYMFRGQRPVVSGMSATTWSYNQSTNGPTFSVAFRPGITFQRMHLIKSCSVTHGFDESQRFVSLRLGVGITGSNPYTVTVETPKDRWVAPRGDYMLFVVGSDGVPSVGTWTHLQ